jgi:alpha-L-fucosidase
MNFKIRNVIIVIFSFFIILPENFLGLTTDRQKQIEWFKNAKFGMFIHWGVYSMLGMQEWIRHEARIPLNEYQYYADNFNPVNYNPNEWVKLAEEAGMKYIVFTSKHHDGFCMYDSKLTDYDIMNSKYGKDIMMMLKKACDKENIRFGIYYSNPDWHHPDYIPRLDWEKESRPIDNADMNRYIMKYEIGQLEELVRSYDPFLLWFDLGGILEMKYEHSSAIEKTLRDLKPELLINDRLYYKRPELADFITPERRVPATGLRKPDGNLFVWEACNAIDYTSWGYNPYSNYYHNYPELIRSLIEIVSKGGNLLLNVAPQSDGTISFEYSGRLKEIGKWMKVNSEAIYGTTASCFERLPFFGKCTVKGNILYFHVMGWPTNKILCIPWLKTDIKKVYLLSDPDNSLSFKRINNDYHIILPERPLDEIATVIKAELSDLPIVEQYNITPDENENVSLPIYMADFSDRRDAYLIHIFHHTFLENWYVTTDTPYWDFITYSNAKYEVKLSYAIARNGGGDFKVIVNGKELPGTIEQKGRSYYYSPFTASIGYIDLPSGKHNLQIKIANVKNNNIMRLEKLELIKSK